MTIIIGIDPSLTATGIADQFGHTYTITYEPDEIGDHRIRRIYDEIRYLFGVTKKPATHAVIEGMLEHRGHSAGTQGMVQGVVRLACLRAFGEYVIAPPATLKKFATGRGNATKDDMRMEWYKRTGQDVRDNNQVDAAWLRELGLHLAGQPTFELPASHRVALEKLQKWTT